LYPGITISKIFYIFFIVHSFFILLPMIKKRKFYLSRFLRFSFFILIINSIISVIHYPNSIDEALVEIWFKNFPKIILFYLFLNYFCLKGKVFYENSLKYLMFIPFVIPLIYNNFTTNFQVFSWYNESDRKFLESADPNEYTILLVLLVPIIMYRMFKSNNIIFKSISALSLVLILSISFQTASKSGFLSYLIAFSLSTYFLSKRKITTIMLVLVIGPLLFFLISNLLPDLLNFSSVLTRFTSSVVSGKGDLTSGRTELWMSGLDGFMQNPFFGNGGGIKTSIDFNYLNVGDDNVFHSTFIQLLFHFGAFVFMAFIYYLFKITPSRTDLKKSISYTNVFFVCMITSLVALFSLSWLWKEIFWIICSILIINKILYNENSTNHSFFS